MCGLFEGSLIRRAIFAWGGSDLIEVYRGCPNAWECDEMGHMNVRFYLDRLMKGMVGFASHCGMASAFRENSPSSLAPRDVHIRFMKEAHAGGPFFLRVGVMNHTETAVNIYAELVHGSGEICASYRALFDHIDTQTRQVFAWSPSVSEQFNLLLTTPPENTGPRSIDPNAEYRYGATVSEANTVGAPQTGLSPVLPGNLDVFGWMAADEFVGCISDAASNLFSGYRDAIAASLAKDGITPRIGGAVVEYRLVYRKWPKAGDLISVRSALGQVLGKAREVHHWLLDPVSGEAWATTVAIALNFDLDTRKAVMPSQKELEKFSSAFPTGLTL